ncbi:phage baseplate assembly protein V [Vibrio proteolyticus]
MNDDPFYLIHRLTQRVANLIRSGHVSAVQHDPPRVKVAYDVDQTGQPVSTTWLRYFEERAGHKRQSDPAKVGEQCMVFSPSGDLRNGWVLLGMNSDANPPASADPNKHVCVYDDNTRVEYDRAEHHLTITIAGGDATLNANTFYINADVRHKGDYHQTGNLTTSGKIAALKDIVSAANIQDTAGSMATMRTQYNGHRHGSSPLPDTPMS